MSRTARYLKFTPDNPPESRLQFYDSDKELLDSFAGNALAAHVVGEFVQTSVSGSTFIESNFLIFCQSVKIEMIDHCPHCNSGLHFEDFRCDDSDKVSQNASCRECGYAITDVFCLQERIIRRKSNKSE